MSDIGTAIQYQGETRRHIFDFSPAFNEGETITGTVPDCSITTELGPATLTCPSNTVVDDKEVWLLLTAPDKGRYLVEQAVTSTSGQTLKSRLRLTVL